MNFWCNWRNSSLGVRAAKRASLAQRPYKSTLLFIDLRTKIPQFQRCHARKDFYFQKQNWFIETSNLTSYMGPKLRYMGPKLGYMGLELGYMGLKVGYMGLKLSYMGPKLG